MIALMNTNTDDFRAEERRDMSRIGTNAVAVSPRALLANGSHPQAQIESKRRSCNFEPQRNRKII